MLHERLATLEGSHHSSSSSSISHGSKSSSNGHHQHGSRVGLSDDRHSNVASHRTSSIVHQEAVIEQPKDFDRRSEMTIVSSPTTTTTAGLDDRFVDHSESLFTRHRIDSLNQNAEADSNEDEEVMTTGAMADQHE
jgi:hypothetical protein